MAVTTVFAKRVMKEMVEPVAILMSVQAVRMIVTGMLDVEMPKVRILALAMTVIQVMAKPAVMSTSVSLGVINVIAMLVA